MIAGVDEAGRGALAGAVVAAAVILPRKVDLPGLADSKCISPPRRGRLAAAIREQAVAWSLGRAEVEEIDRLNILHASLLAMRRAVEGLEREPRHVLVDGPHLPPWRFAATAIVGGDGSEPAISAASILAKVARDEEMRALDRKYHGYDLGRHKGYPTGGHLKALNERGPSPIHRRSFAPVRAVC